MADKNNARVKIKLKNVRLSYAHLFKAKKFDEADEGPGKFQTRAIIDPDTKIGGINMDLIQDAIDEVIEAKWGDRPKKLKDDRLFARWADEDEEDPAMQDMYILSASNERRPLTLDRDGEDVVEADDVLYSGMYADLILTVWTQDNKYGVRVNATLEGAKERGEGERLSGAAPIDRSEFDDDDDDDDRGSRRSRRGRDRDEEEDDDDRGSRRSRRGRNRDEEEEDDDRGSRRSRRGRNRDEEEDDRGRGRSRRGRDRDEEEEDDRGRGRSRRGRDEEDEPKSSRRRRSRGDDVT